MLPDQAVVDASRQFLDYGVIGSVVIFLITALWWVVRQWMAAIKDLHAEKDARRADAEKRAEDGEAMRSAVTANTAAMKAVLDNLRDRRPA